MRNLDFGPHRLCHVCHVSHSEKRMIDYKGKWFCGITHKLKHERKQREATHTGNTAVIVFDSRTNKGK